MEFKEIVATRRAANFFDPGRPVSRDLLRQIVEAAAQAPSSYNFQPWSLVVLEDPEKKQRLRKLAMDQPKITEAPVVLLVLGDRQAWQKGSAPFEANFRKMVESGMPESQYGWLADTTAKLYGSSSEASQAFACKNAGFFAMALMFAARDMGLHTHPMDGFDHEAVRKEFNIPDRYWIPLLLAVGWFNSAKEMPKPKWRKSFDQIVMEF